MKNKQEFFQQVVPHEVAHLITFQVYGKVRPHGKEWQHVMEQVFKCPATTTHQLDIKDVVGKLFTYQCACTTHQLTIRRHNKVQKGCEYRCRSCKATLAYKPAI